jgi:ketosteroid isomerase-like protein
METRELVQNFYASLAARDTRWHDHLADAVDFSDASGRLRAQGREAFIQAFTSFVRSVRSIELRQLIVEGAAAAAVVGYNYRNPSGDVLHQEDAEVWKVEEGEVVSLTIYFDITEFQAFMGR